MATTKKELKKVSFDAVEIREYPIVLSTNPATKYGPVLELGWEYRLASRIQPIDPLQRKEREIEGRLLVNEYEALRPSAQRRTLKGLYLFQPTREYRIKLHNYSDAEIAEAVAEKAKIFESRERSNLCRNPVSIICEGCILSARRTKKVKRAVRNLNKRKAAAADRRDIYRGWWLPFSACLF
jgi:hypothetical protein